MGLGHAFAGICLSGDLQLDIADLENTSDRSRAEGETFDQQIGSSRGPGEGGAEDGTGGLPGFLAEDGDLATSGPAAEIADTLSRLLEQDDR